MPLAKRSNNLFVCYVCNYTTDREGKLQRHFETEKHYIAVYGITCCGITYYDKHKYVNHKKSEKHRYNMTHHPDLVYKKCCKKQDLVLTLKKPTSTITPKNKDNGPKTVLDLSPTSVKA